MKTNSADTIEDIREETLESSRFIIPIQISYKQNGFEKRWEAVKSHESVAVLLYHKEKKAFVLVKQFRPPVYLRDPRHSFTYELCAGLLDKEIDPVQTIQEEINEECGYHVPLDQISKVTSFYTCVGISNAHQTLYYAQIDESMRVHSGGGIHNESIELFYLSLEQAKTFAINENYPKTPGLMFAFYWFFDHHPGAESLSRN